VELDVRPAADGTLVVHHDPELLDGRAVHAVAPSELPPWVPRLEDALEACAGLGANIELKSEGDAARDECAVESLAVLSSRLDPATTLVTSFAWGLVDRLHELAPDLPTGLLVVDPSSWLEPVAAAAAGGHRSVNVAQGYVEEDLVARAHAEGLVVHAWTVNDPDRMEQLVAHGVDALITDVPDVARAVVGPV
jgi:glycerophosphoryl diester phosphodiesterase